MANITDIESEDFQVLFADNTVEDFIKSEDHEYRWASGPDGTLFIYRVTKHRMFAAKIKDERYRAIAAGGWKEVQVLDRVEEEYEGQESEADTADAKSVIETL